jgi:hypothetical protein
MAEPKQKPEPHQNDAALQQCNPDKAPLKTINAIPSERHRPYLLHVTV